MLLIGIGFFGVKTWSYYTLMRSGKLVDLPQFTGHLTTEGLSNIVSGSFVDPQMVDGNDAPVLGNTKDPKLTIVEFADFECPYSKEAHAVIRRMAAKYGDQVKVVYRDYPLEAVHPSAFQVAEAAECAREQGKFWAYHDKLYANSPALGFNDLLRYAQETNLDSMQFKKCLVSERYRDNVTKDLRLAETIGLRGTPTFFFNGQKVEGSIPETDFQNIIDRMLK